MGYFGIVFVGKCSEGYKKYLFGNTEPRYNIPMSFQNLGLCFSSSTFFMLSNFNIGMIQGSGGIFLKGDLKFVSLPLVVWSLVKSMLKIQWCSQGQNFKTKAWTLEARTTRFKLRPRTQLFVHVDLWGQGQDP